MTRQILQTIAVATVCAAAVAGAQELPAGSSDPNEIFNSMMQTMPDAMKSRVDSASTVQQSRKESSSGKPAQTGTAATTRVSGTIGQPGVDELPEAVREQVRKTMRELEAENTARMLQFKEMQKQK